VTTHPDRVDPSTVRDWLAQSDAVTVIDVRSPAEFETVHIPGSLNVPLNMLDEHAEAIAARLDGNVVLLCQSGPRSTQARRQLAGVGAEGARVLDGGISGYITAGGDVVRGRARWSLERQVRLVAGTLVLAGLLAGLRWPKARLLAGGIGTGLTLSALTDTCTMSRVLSALPYNRAAHDPDPSEILGQLPAATTTA
jgi:rhodanese-related sulfurtransferase